MTTKRIIPCLDVKNGKVVKGINFLALRIREIRPNWLKGMRRKVPMR